VKQFGDLGNDSEICKMIQSFVKWFRGL